MTRWSLLCVLLAGCDNQPVLSDVSQTCTLPTTNMSPLPLSDTPIQIYPNAQDTMIDGVTASFEITSDEMGDYHLAWMNPDSDGGSLCFSGLVTTAMPLGTTITPDDGIEQVKLNTPEQIVFASVEATALEGFTFSAGTQTVYLEVYVGGEPGTYIFYTDESSGLSTSVQTNVGAFISP